MNDYLIPRGPAPQIVPGEDTFLAWNPARQSVEYAQYVARQIRAQGGKVLGCTLDTRVKRGNRCPVCGKPGLF